MWKAGLLEYDAAQEVDWKWQAADGCQTKAPLGGQATGKNPTDRGKRGTKRSLLVEGKGVPIAIVVSGAQRHALKLLAKTLELKVLESEVSAPAPEEQNLCLDKAYTGESARQIRPRTRLCASRSRQSKRQSETQRRKTQGTSVDSRSDTFLVESV